VARATSPSSAPPTLLGSEHPRLGTEPQRRLTRRTSAGWAVADFADQILGEPLLPWQRQLAIRGLEINPDGTYRYRTVLALAGRQNGKTSLLRTLTLWRLYVATARLVLGVGQTAGLAREVWKACLDQIRTTPELRQELEHVRNFNGDEQFQLSTGGRYKIAPATRGSARGLSVDLLIFDELREQRSWDAWSALSKTTMARPAGQTWCLSNAGDDQSIVLNHLREAALSGRDPSIGLFEWSGPEGCDLDDWQAIAQANPGLGYTISEQAIRSALGTDPPAVFRTEVLCQRVESLDEAIELAAWRDCADPAGNLNGLRDRVVACVDVAPDGEHATLAVGAQLDDGRVRGEIAAAWKSTREARAQIGDLLDQIQPRVTAWYPSGPAASLAPLLRPRTGSLELKGQQVSEACQGLADLVAARRILHSADPLLDGHISGAQKYYTGDGWRFVRRGAGHVDAAYAYAGAIHVALTVPIIAKIRPLVVAGGQRAG
jgi:hypothetical protein